MTRPGSAPLDRRARLGTVRRAAGLVGICAVILASVVGRSLSQPPPRAALGSGPELALPVGPGPASVGPDQAAAAGTSVQPAVRPAVRPAAQGTVHRPRTGSAKHPATAAKPTAARHTRTPGTRTSAAPTTSAARTTHPAANTTTAPTTTAPTTTAAPPPATRRTITGGAFDVGYGVVQVRATFDGRRLVDVTAVSLPQGGRSSDISAMAEPQLRQEAMTAQSANIDAVSGATYTSAGYAKSLQSAIDAAGR